MTKNIPLIFDLGIGMTIPVVFRIQAENVDKRIKLQKKKEKRRKK